MKHGKKLFAAGLAATMAVNAVCLSSLFSGSAADTAKYEFEDGVITGTSTTVEDAATASGGKVVHLKDAGRYIDHQSQCGKGWHVRYECLLRNGWRSKDTEDEYQRHTAVGYFFFQSVYF